VTTEQADKGQIGLSEEVDLKIKEIIEEGRFDHEQDVYRLAIAIALAEDLEPAPESRAYKTKFNVGSLDPEHSLRTATQYLRIDHGGRPQAMMERLAEAGVEHIHSHLNAGKPLHELLVKYARADDSSTEEQTADVDEPRA